MLLSSHPSYRTTLEGVFAEIVRHRDESVRVPEGRKECDGTLQDQCFVPQGRPRIAHRFKRWGSDEKMPQAPQGRKNAEKSRSVLSSLAGLLLPSDVTQR